jgi:hypothetical protein
MGSNIDFGHEQNTPFPGVNHEHVMCFIDLTDGSLRIFRALGRSSR